MVNRIPWTNPRLADGERLVKFERWLTRELRTHIEWPEGPAGEKVLYRCREVIRAQLRVLAERGWLLDSKPLAEFLSKPIREVGQIQKTHGIENIYGYFIRKFCRYVDERAEEIQCYSNRIGHSIKNLDRMVRSIPELEEERHRESMLSQMRRARRAADQKAMDRFQGRLSL